MPRPAFDPTDVGWRLGRSRVPHGVDLWCRYDRTPGVYGEQGAGKTLDLLAPALLAHRGAGLATLTKVDDLLLTAGRRQQALHPEGPPRPIAVLDPFGAAPGLPELVWDPIAGCVDPQIPERRAKAFAAGTVTGAVTGGRQDNAARFYAAETAKVLQGFLHAAALTGRTLEHVLEWVANPVAAEQPAEILQQHPHAARFWDGLLAGALHGSPDTVGNTVTTVQQAMALFFQPQIRARCVPARGRPATDLADLIARQGTVYLLGHEDPYASAAPLMTAVAEHVLDTALQIATRSPHGRLTPCFLACLDRELSDLLDDVRISRQTVTDGPGGVGTSRSGEDVRVLRPGDIRRIPERHALVVAGTAPPIVARLRRCLDGREGARLKAELDAARADVAAARTEHVD